MAENQVQEGYPEAFTLREALEAVLEAASEPDREFTHVEVSRATSSQCTYRVYRGGSEYADGGVITF